MVTECYLMPRSKTPNPPGNVLVLTKFLIGIEVWLVSLDNCTDGRHCVWVLVFFVYGYALRNHCSYTVLCCSSTQRCVVNPTGKLIAQEKRTERQRNHTLSGSRSGVSTGLPTGKVDNDVTPCRHSMAGFGMASGQEASGEKVEAATENHR